jgi:hypothetical protein
VQPTFGSNVSSTPSALMLQAIYFSETSVDFNWTTRRVMPEDAQLFLPAAVRTATATHLTSITVISSVRLYSYENCYSAVREHNLEYLRKSTVRILVYMYL